MERVCVCERERRGMFAGVCVLCKYVCMSKRGREKERESVCMCRKVSVEYVCMSVEGKR